MDYPSWPEVVQLCLALGRHWVAAMSGGIGVLLSAWGVFGRRYTRPAFVVASIAALLSASVFAWLEEYRAREKAEIARDNLERRDSEISITLSGMHREYYKRLNFWWTYCHENENNRLAFNDAEDYRSRLYDTIKGRVGVVEANFFNVLKASDQVPVGVAAKSSRCIDPHILGEYWNRMDRLETLIQRIRRK